MVKHQEDSNAAPDPAQTVRESDADRRRFQRVDLPLKARFLTEDGCERAGTVTNISVGGAMIRAKFPPAFGQGVILYVDQVGRLEAKVVRSDKNSFAVTYHKRREKHVKLADQITAAMHHRRRRGPDHRTGPRVKFDKPATVYLEDGQSLECAILDVSLTGASIEVSPRPPLGMHLILGRMTAKVVRRHDKGVGVVFTGAADRMDEIIDKTRHEPDPAAPDGPNIAPSFGRKGR